MKVTTLTGEDPRRVDRYIVENFPRDRGDPEGCLYDPWFLRWCDRMRRELGISRANEWIWWRCDRLKKKRAMEKDPKYRLPRFGKCRNPQRQLSDRIQRKLVELVAVHFPKGHPRTCAVLNSQFKAICECLRATVGCKAPENRIFRAMLNVMRSGRRKIQERFKDKGQ